MVRVWMAIAGTLSAGMFCLLMWIVFRALRQARAAGRHVAQVAEELGRTQQRLAETLRSQRQLTDHLAELSLRDALTGLYNRRHFDGEHNRLLAAEAQAERPLSVAVVDVDNFKDINDRFGHPVGDEVLRMIGQLLTERSRERDVVARFGGEEFALLMPGCSGKAAARICERLRHEIESHPWDRMRSGLRVTVSVGVADTVPGTAPAEHLREADQLLYQAKHAGKNQVCQASLAASRKRRILEQRSAS